MPAVSRNIGIREFQSFISQVYGLPNDRHFELAEMHGNIQRFAMRGLKGIRKGDPDRIKKNMVISFSWFISTMNRLHIDIEDEVWTRFPHLCSYCGSCPCRCKSQRVAERQQVVIDATRRPASLAEYQSMFAQIYPASGRTLEHAGVHLSEEVGELTEAILAYRGERTSEDFDNLMLEAADYFSCVMGVFNSMTVDFAHELATFYPENCHACHRAPCVCSYVIIKKYKS